MIRKSKMAESIAYRRFASLTLGSFSTVTNCCSLDLVAPITHALLPWIFCMQLRNDAISIVRIDQG